MRNGDDVLQSDVYCLQNMCTVFVLGFWVVNWRPNLMRHIGLACAFVRLCGGKRPTLATKNCIYIRCSSCVSTSDRSVDFTIGRCKVYGHFPPVWGGLVWTGLWWRGPAVHWRGYSVSSSVLLTHFSRLPCVAHNAVSLHVSMSLGRPSGCSFNVPPTPLWSSMQKVARPT